MSKVLNEKKINVKALTPYIFSKILYKVDFSKKKRKPTTFRNRSSKNRNKKRFIIN